MCLFLLSWLLLEDLLAIEHFRLSQLGYDLSRDWIFINTSQSLGRGSTSIGLHPCVTPNARIWMPRLRLVVDVVVAVAVVVVVVAGHAQLFYAGDWRLEPRSLLSKACSWISTLRIGGISGMWTWAIWQGTRSLPRCSWRWLWQC